MQHVSRPPRNRNIEIDGRANQKPLDFKSFPRCLVPFQSLRLTNTTCITKCIQRLSQDTAGPRSRSLAPIVSLPLCFCVIVYHVSHLGPYEPVLQKGWPDPFIRFPYSPRPPPVSSIPLNFRRGQNYSLSTIFKIQPHGSPPKGCPWSHFFIYIALDPHSPFPSLNHEDAHTSSLYFFSATILSTRARPCSMGTPLPWANTCGSNRAQ